MTIDRYLQLRLGAGPPLAMATNMFTRAFTAPSLRTFWWYWNPGYGFYLLTYCYQPLRRVLPPSSALFATFLLCGFLLHDTLYLLPMLLTGEQSLPLPFVTCWFLFIAAGVTVSDWLRIHFHGVRAPYRVLIHLGFLAVTFGLTLVVSAQF